MNATTDRAANVLSPPLQRPRRRNALSGVLARLAVFAGAFGAACSGDVPGEFETSDVATEELTLLSATTSPSFRASLPSPSDHPDILLDAAESTSGWSGTTLDTTEFKHGRASLKRTASTARFYRVFSTPVDVSNMRFLTFWYYVDDPTKLGGTDQQVEIGSAGTWDREERNWAVSNLKLHRGWNYVVLDIAGARHRTEGGVQANLTRINWFRIYHHPTATVTTRIDQIVFTNRLPRSLPVSRFLNLKETNLRHPTGAATPERTVFAEIMRLSATNTRRTRECRRLRLARQQRAVSQFTLDALGVGANAVNALRTLEAYVCNEQTIPSATFDTVVNTAARDYIAAEVNLVQRFAARFGIADYDAAETASKLFELDAARIFQTCGTVDAELASYMATGATPAGITGPNPLFRNCQVSSLANLPQEISVRISTGRPMTTTAGDRYAACWNAFASQASQCSDPAASQGAMTEFEEDLHDVPEFRGDPARRQELLEFMDSRLNQIESLSLAEANELIDAHNQEPGGVDVPLVSPTTANPHPRRDELLELHREHDDSMGQAQVARTLGEGALAGTDGAAETELGRQAVGEAYYNTAWENEVKAEETRAKICAIDPNDMLCEQAPPPPEPAPGEGEPDDGGEAVARCAEVDVGGRAAWYETPTGDGTTASREVNSVDRINHCLCEVFDRQYPDLPQFQAVEGVNVSPFCPDPAERVMHECTQPGWDDGPPDPKCLFGLVSEELDYSGLMGKLCDAMKSARCPNPEMLANDRCNCWDLPPPPEQPPTQRCQNAVMCDPNTQVPDAASCGCRALDTPRICAGNVLTSTQPLVNFRADVAALAGRPLLSVSTSMPVVTRAVTKASLTNGNRFDFGVFNPFGGGAMTGTAELRCTNLSTGVSNYLVERINLATLGSGSVSNAAATFSNSDLTQCFGANQASASNLEVAFQTSRAVPRLSLVPNGALGRILEPVFPTQPCTIPTLGPLPRPPWNMSTGQVIRFTPPTFPIMQANGLITLPHTVEEPLVFTKNFAPSSLNLIDDSTTPVTSQLAVTREGPVTGLTLQLRMRGDWLAGRFNVRLLAPNGTEVYDASGHGSDDDSEAGAELFDGGIVIEPPAALESEGTWTLQIRDVGGNDDRMKSGDLYTWSLNFHSVQTWDAPPSSDDPGTGSFPPGWSCNGTGGFEEFPGQFYGDGGCDCGCGAMDIDCATNQISACEYEFCSQPGRVNPNNIALCL